LIVRSNAKDGRTSAYSIPTALPEETKVPEPNTNEHAAPYDAATGSTKVPIRELVARCYKPLGEEEFALLKAWFPDPRILAEKLERLFRDDNRPLPELEIGFSIEAIKKFGA
jgi:hypothetical protein